MQVRGPSSGLRRVSVSNGKAASSFTPRSFGGGASLAESVTSSWMERASVELRRLHSAGSARHRPSVSSPTEGSFKTSSHSLHLPPSLVSSYSSQQISTAVVGFQVEHKSQSVPGLPKAPTRVKGGLLAQALIEEEVGVGASLQVDAKGWCAYSKRAADTRVLLLVQVFSPKSGQLSPAVEPDSVGSNFFPDVDLTLLHDAQVQSQMAVVMYMHCLLTRFICE